MYIQFSPYPTLLLFTLSYFLPLPPTWFSLITRGTQNSIEKWMRGMQGGIILIKHKRRMAEYRSAMWKLLIYSFCRHFASINSIRLDKNKYELCIQQNKSFVHDAATLLFIHSERRTVVPLLACSILLRSEVFMMKWKRWGRWWGVWSVEEEGGGEKGEIPWESFQWK